MSGSESRMDCAILTPCWSTAVAAWLPAMAAGRSFWFSWICAWMPESVWALVMLEGGLSPARGVMSVCWTAMHPPNSWALRQRTVQTLPAEAV